MQKARLRAMWRKIDIDSGGTISRAEFRRALDPYLSLVDKERNVKAGMLPTNGKWGGGGERGSSLDRVVDQAVEANASSSTAAAASAFGAGPPLSSKKRPNGVTSKTGGGSTSSMSRGSSNEEAAGSGKV